MLQLIYKHKNRFLILGAVFALTLGFYYNFWHIVSEAKFTNFQKDSESLVIGRLYIAQEEGIWSKRGFLGRIYYADVSRDTIVDYQYKIYNNNLQANINQFGPYYSQIGGQGWLFAFLDSILPFSNKIKLELFYLFNAFLSAVLFTIFLFVILKHFGLKVTLISLFFILISPFPTLFADNLYWVLWAFYIPFVGLLWMMYKEWTKTPTNFSYSNFRIFLTAFIFIFLKLFFTGFEYITTILISFIIPFLFYASFSKWKKERLIKRISIVACASVIAVGIYMVLLAFQLSDLKDNVSGGFEYIFDTFLRRTDGNSADFDPIYKQSLEAGILETLNRYSDFYPLGLCFILFSAVLFKLKKADQKYKALLITTWLSILAPLSWLIIFKAHSYIHIHMNEITFYMPFALFGFVVVASVLVSITKHNIIDNYQKIRAKISNRFNLL